MSTNETTAERYVARVRENLKPIETLTRYFYLGLLWLVVLFGLALGIQAWLGKHSRNAFEVFLLATGVSLIVVVTATAVGFLLGFLFGIPRSLQRAAPPRENDVKINDSGPSQSSSPKGIARTFISNTSLEEVSDWLTKIIIGLGLVQFQLVIEYLHRSALYAASFVAAENIPAEQLADMTTLGYDARLATPFYFALIVATLIAGCLFSYLETRTRLLLLFVDAEGAEREHTRILAENAGELPVVIPQRSDDKAGQLKGERNTPIRVAPSAEDAELIKVPLESLKTAKEIIGWASAQARATNYAEAERALLIALAKDPSDDSIRERLVSVRNLNKDVAGAIKMTLEIANRATDERKRYDLLHRALYDALYADSPEGVTLALEISKPLLETPQGQRSAQVHLWRACALGQRYRSLKDKGENVEDPVLKAIRDEALEHLKKIVTELAPSYQSPERELMRSLYEGRFGTEDDLKVFQSAAFDAVVYDGRA